MKIFALADLHLSLKREFDPMDETLYNGEKSMALFGNAWDNHIKRIYDYWHELVADEDLVLIAGDISWAMNLAEAKFDLNFLSNLPGRKIMIRGNHDYWWVSPTQIRKCLNDSVELIQNNAICFDDFAVCGTRFWNLPESQNYSADDEHIYRRELIRTELSLKAAKGLPVIFMSHFMPIPVDGSENEFTDLCKQYRVEKVIYGHLHGKSHAIAVEGERHGSEYYLTSADYLNCKPRFIGEV